MELRGGVVKLVPVPRDTPPTASEYQLIMPALAVAPNTSVPVPHCEVGVVPVMAGIGLTVAITAVLEGVVHPAFVASTQ